jgi:hypothetical protein
VLWLVATLLNMWVGVNKGQALLEDEASVVLLVFAVPCDRCHCHLVEIVCFLS